MIVSRKSLIDPSKPSRCNSRRTSRSRRSAVRLVATKRMNSWSRASACSALLHRPRFRRKPR